MKLSKTAWNNVIIFSVMIIILLINASNDRLFPENTDRNNTLLLPKHSVVLALTITFPNQSQIIFERIGRAWKMTSQGMVLNFTNQQIDQLIFTWQQTSGLIQAAEIIIDGKEGTQVKVSLAGIEQDQQFTFYSLTDQLLIFNHQTKIWLAVPSVLSQQLTPTS